MAAFTNQHNVHPIVLFAHRTLRGAVSPLAYQLHLKWALLRNSY